METSENKGVVYEFGKFVLDPKEKTLFADGSPLHLPAKEFETLLLLIENNGKALTKDEMMTAIWQDAFVEESNLAKQISRLRKIFNTGDNKLIETLPKHGYRFSADVRRTIPIYEEPVIFEKRTLKRLTVKVEDEFDENPRALPEPAKKSSIALPVAALGLIILCGAAALWFWKSGTKTPAVRINSIAVLPLKSLTAEENNQALGLGLTDALITKLGTLRQIVVRPTSAVVQFADAPDSLEIGRRLKTDAVLEGTIQQSEGRIRINTRLLKVENGEQIWTEKFDEPTNNIFALQDALSAKIAKTLAFELTNAERAQFARYSTENTEAYEKYLRGRFYQSQNTEQGLTKAIEFYEQAIALDANFAEPYAGIADADLILYNFGLRPAGEVIPKAVQSVNRALQLNPNLSGAYNSRALIQFLYEKNWLAAEQSLQRAIELSPNNADAFLRYGYFLINVGKFDDALVKLEKARELNPLSPLVQADIGLAHLCARRYPKAIEQLEKVVAENPEFPLSHWFLGAAYAGSGDAEKAFASNLRGLETEGGGELASRLRSVKENKGLPAAEQLWLDESLKAKENGNLSALFIASRYAALKNREQTLAWLEKAFDEGEPTFAVIKYLAEYDFIRDDECFRRLLQKIEFK
jgi:TolB-like protein/DNA-binding winged helix-turn-helix (wHTH) protein